MKKTIIDLISDAQSHNMRFENLHGIFDALICQLSDNHSGDETVNSFLYRIDILMEYYGQITAAACKNLSELWKAVADKKEPEQCKRLDGDII